MPDSYLEIAEKAIRHAKRPLHPKEMLNIANNLGQVPSHLSGKTQYKTLAARLSTDIRARAKSTAFYRTSANLFYLREFMDSTSPEYLAPRRQKTLHSEKVLSIDNTFLETYFNEDLDQNVNDLFDAVREKKAADYVVRRDAEKRYDVKQVIAYALVYRAGLLLTYRRGAFTNAADELRGLRSIGFGGHVTDEDMNLFDIDSFGVVENARRELREELLFTNFESERLNETSSFSFLCCLNTYETDEAKKHLAIAVVYYCSPEFEPKKNEMSINDLRWTNLSEIENNLDDFEPWSRQILNELYAGNLKIE